MLRISEHWEESDLGRQRQGNEDNLFVRSPLFVVADGMGGAQAGEVASKMAVDSFDDGMPDGSPSEALVQIIEGANRAIHDRSRTDARTAGMGTTLTAAYVGESEVTIAHVGDSRAYLLRGGDLIRLTHDHSLVGELVLRGKLTEEQAEMHPQRSVITRALGSEPDVEVDVHVYQAKAGDVFMLNSDGLTSMVPDDRVKGILGGASSLEQAGRDLIAAANDAGGRDNITVILFRVEDVDGARGAAAGRDDRVRDVGGRGGRRAASGRHQAGGDSQRRNGGRVSADGDDGPVRGQAESRADRGAAAADCAAPARSAQAPSPPDPGRGDRGRDRAR